MTCSTASEGKPGSQAAARLLILGAAALLLGLSACAGNAPPTPSAALSPPPVQAIPETAAPPISLAPPPPSLSPTDAAVELARLRKSFAREVPHGIPAGTASDAPWITGARAAVGRGGPERSIGRSCWSWSIAIRACRSCASSWPEPDTAGGRYVGGQPRLDRAGRTAGLLHHPGRRGSCIPTRSSTTAPRAPSTRTTFAASG